ncbi:MAG: hypothetical protein ACOC2H_10905, partial [Spirochaetota bacterium]
HISPETCSQLFKILDFFETEKSSGGQWYERFRSMMRRRVLINYAPGDVVIIDRSMQNGDLPQYLQEGARITIKETDNTASTVTITHNGKTHTVPFTEASAVYAKPAPKP